MLRSILLFRANNVNRLLILNFVYPIQFILVILLAFLLAKHVFIITQSDYTLWRLKAFVKDALEEQEKVDEGAAVNPNDNPDDKKNKKRRDSGDSSGKTNPKRKKLSAL